MSDLHEIHGGEFRKAPGSTDIMGHGGPLYTYSIYVQTGTGIKRPDVARLIDATLGDPKRGWTRNGGVRFRRTESGGTMILVAKGDVVDRACFPLQTNGEVSCCNGTTVALNAERWKEAVPHWTGPLKTYRQMLINHEVGHRIGQSHRYCDIAGSKAPVMQQQTYGLQGCQANSWPLAYEVNSL